MIKIKDGFRGERTFILPPACVEEVQSHMLSRILYITDIGYYPSAVNHYRLRRQPIGQYVFIYCVSGAGWYEIDDVRHEVRADSYFILPPDKPHSYGAAAADPWTIYWIHFNGTLAPLYLLESAEPIEVKPGVKSRIADRLDIFEEIMATLDNGFGLENLLYACSTFHHFLGSLRFMTQFRETRQRKTEAASEGFDPVEAAIHYMNENVGKRLKLGSIADYVGYSPTQLSAMFSKKTGVSPMAYFNTIKIKSACRLLMYSDLKINQICHKVGIADQYYFSRLFTKETGVSPSQYRRANRPLPEANA